MGSPFDLLLDEDDPEPTRATQDATSDKELARYSRDTATDALHAHAAYRLYSAAGLDACAIGNHDLDWGERRLARSLAADARFPALAANLTGCPTLEKLRFPAAIFVVQGVRVAVIGLTTPAQVARLPGSTLTVADPLVTLHNLLPALMAVSDVRIVLSHLGHSLAANPATVIMAGDVELARSLPPGAVHLIVGGHTHHALNQHGLEAANVVNGIPIVQAGCSGDFVGEVDLTVANGRVEVIAARLIPTENLPADEGCEADRVQPLAREVRRHMEAPLAHVEACLDQPGLARFMADGLAERCRLAGFAVDCAVVDNSCIGAELTPGPLTADGLRGMMPYADTIQLVQLSGRQLCQLLATRSATGCDCFYFSREISRCLGAPRAGGQPDTSQAAINGLPLAQQLERVFTLACTSFMARVTQRALFTAGSQETGLFVRRELAAYVRRKGSVSANDL